MKSKNRRVNRSYEGCADRRGKEGKEKRDKKMEHNKNTGTRKISFDGIGRNLMRDSLSARSLDVEIGVGENQGFEVLRVRWRR